jgi:hypothetical protein
MNALVKRINRKLHAREQVLKKGRGAEISERHLGPFYVVHYRNGVTQSHVDPESLGRELGVLREDESVS